MGPPFSLCHSSPLSYTPLTVCIWAHPDGALFWLAAFLENAPGRIILALVVLIFSILVARKFFRGHLEICEGAEKKLLF